MMLALMMLTMAVTTPVMVIIDTYRPIITIGLVIIHMNLIASHRRYHHPVCTHRFPPPIAATAMGEKSRQPTARKYNTESTSKDSGGGDDKKRYERSTTGKKKKRSPFRSALLRAAMNARLSAPHCPE